MKVRTALTILIAIMAVCILVVGATAVWVGQQGPSDVLAADDFVEEPADPAASLNDELSDADLARIAGLQQNAELLPAGKEEIQMVTDDGSRLRWFSRTPSVVADGRIWPVEGPPDGDNANNVYFGGPLEGRGSWGDAGLLDEDPYVLDKGEGVSWGESAPYEFLYFDEFPFTRQQHGLSTNTLLDLGMSREDAGRHNGYLFHDGTTIFHVTGQGTPETTVTALSPVSGFREFRF